MARLTHRRASSSGGPGRPRARLRFLRSRRPGARLRFLRSRRPGARLRFLRSRRAERAPEASAGPPPAAPGPYPRQSRIPGLLASWLRPERAYSEAECFIPFPKITFLLDQPRDLTCQICRSSRFEMKPSPSADEGLDDSIFALLPCGHVAGSRCLARWLRAHDHCPFCRLRLVYGGCGHIIAAQPVTSESVHLLPRTLPDRGTVPALCNACLRDKLGAEATARFEAARRELEDARGRCVGEGVPEEEDEDRLLLAREEFENAVRDQLHFKALNSWLTDW